MSSIWASKTVITIILVVVVIYALLMWPSCTGYGYAGHGGYHHGPSFWYFGGVSTYHSPSVRAGSRSGPGVTGGGK